MIREAATIILLRPRVRARSRPLHFRPAAARFEVFFLRRHRGASFMASAFVFPGGATDAGEDARTAAVRELFEEAGVLLATPAPERAIAETLRARVLAGAPTSAALAEAGLAWATDELVPWSHWITPSIEAKRFSAQFFVAELPAGQEPRFDATETVEQLWVTPEDALARAAELRLPPPQVRTCWELAQYADLAAVVAAGRLRGDELHPIMPRLAPGPSPCLLLPWDPEYASAGTGESTPFARTPRWAVGPSRFVMEDRAWKHVAAPGSTTAG